MFQGWRFSLARREWRVRFSSGPLLLTNLLRFMEQKIYQCGFYVMIGLILGVVLSFSIFRRPMHIINPVTTDTIVVSDTQAYRQFGNSVVVPLMTDVAGLIVDKLKELFDLKYLSETDYEEKKKKIFMKYEYRKVFHLSA